MLSKRGFLVALKPGKVQNGIQGTLQKFQDIRSGVVSIALCRFRPLECALFAAESFHPGSGRNLRKGIIFIGQTQHMINALIQFAHILPFLAETVVKLGHGIEQVVPEELK